MKPTADFRALTAMLHALDSPAPNRRVAPGLAEVKLSATATGLILTSGSDFGDGVEDTASATVHESGTTPTASMAGDDLARAVCQVATAAGDDEACPFLMGMQLELTGSTLQMTATDRYRIAHREAPITRHDRRRPKPTVVPAKQLVTAAKALRHHKTVSLAFPAKAGGVLEISTDETTFTLHPVRDADRYPNIKKLIHAELTTALTVPSRPLVTALRRIQQFCGESPLPVVDLHATSDGLHLSSSNNGTRLTDHVDCTHTGDDIQIAYQPLSLLEGLRAMRRETVQINLDSKAPALLKTPEEDRSALIYGLMPVR